MKQIIKITFGCIMMLFLSVCFAVAAQPERIVSLAPNITEILYSLGLGEKIVGVTSYCDRPEDAKRKPKIGGMVNPSLEAILAARPDIVIMTTDGNPAGIDERLNKMGIRTYILHERRLQGLPQEINLLGRALGVGAKASTLADGMDRAFAKIRAGQGKARGRKNVLFIVWPEPLIVAGPGTQIDDAIRLLGWNNIASDAIGNYPKFSIEEVARRSPDVIIIGMAANMEAASSRFLEKLHMLDAVKKGKVYYVGDDLYRSGPRVVKGLRDLAEYLK
jgi:iron complex transport system substrate-binding protein